MTIRRNRQQKAQINKQVNTFRKEKKINKHINIYKKVSDCKTNIYILLHATSPPPKGKKCNKNNTKQQTRGTDLLVNLM